ncbi:MAG: hypothetical protein Q8R63_07515, partial [Ramlibacter sp.]|nr:hypothetical protein [Ramlibacter sp.]
PPTRPRGEIPIAHGPGPRLPPLEAFERRPSAQSEPARTGQHPKPFTLADIGGLPGSGRWRTGPRNRAATSRIGPSELALAIARAIQPTAFDLQKVTWRIELLLEERKVDAKGNVRQPEWKCDGAMIDRIDRAEEGDHIAIFTIDGNLMRDATGGLVPEIAAALLRAAEKRRVRIWLFTFAGLGTPGPDLLIGVE